MGESSLSFDHSNMGFLTTNDSCTFGHCIFHFQSLPVGGDLDSLIVHDRQRALSFLSCPSLTAVLNIENCLSKWC